MASGLSQTGFTFYDLNALRHSAAESAPMLKDGGGRGSVVELDFYYAKTLLAMGDEEVVRTAIAALGRAVPGVYGSLVQSDVVDSAVVRAPSAVSHFSPASFEFLPAIQSRALGNWFWAGDWIDRGGHRSWSQEKAYVTGLQAAKCAVLKTLGREAAAKVQDPMDVEPDEPHIIAGRAAARATRALLETFFAPGSVSLKG